MSFMQFTLKAGNGSIKEVVMNIIVIKYLNKEGGLYYAKH